MVARGCEYSCSLQNISILFTLLGMYTIHSIVIPNVFKT